MQLDAHLPNGADIVQQLDVYRPSHCPGQYRTLLLLLQKGCAEWLDKHGWSVGYARFSAALAWHYVAVLRQLCDLS